MNSGPDDTGEKKMKKHTALGKAAIALLAAGLLLGSGLCAGASAQGVPTIKKLADVSSLFESQPSVTKYVTVLEVRRVPFSGRDGDLSTAMVLKLRSMDGEYLAYMGPTRFLDRRGVSFVPGETLVIQGVRVEREGEPWLISRVFSNSEAVLALRDGGGRLGTSLLSGSLACGEDVICSR